MNISQPMTAFVKYEQPSFEELKSRFPGFVNPDYKGRKFDPIQSCMGVNRENREVVFEYIRIRYGTTKKVLATIERKGLRPALYEELLSFDEKYPGEQEKYEVVALGSEVRMRSNRFVAYLRISGSGRSLRLYWVNDSWTDDYYFLVVRE